MGSIVFPLVAHIKEKAQKKKLCSHFWRSLSSPKKREKWEKRQSETRKSNNKLKMARANYLIRLSKYFSMRHSSNPQPGGRGRGSRSSSRDRVNACTYLAAFDLNYQTFSGISTLNASRQPQDKSIEKPSSSNDCTMLAQQLKPSKSREFPILIELIAKSF